VPENRVPRRIFGPKTKELEAEYRPNCIRIFMTFTQQVALTMMKSKGMRWSM
jgi:hypothetical protein